MIDVGGPALIRAAAKNHARVAVVVDPADYAPLLEEIRDDRRHEPRDARAARRARLRPHGGLRRARSPATSPARGARRRRRSPRTSCFAFERVGALRYGENPHQRAALYREPHGAARRARPLPDAPGQGALVQQPPRPRLRGHARARLRRPGRRHRQAQQPVRRRRSATRSSEAFGRAFACDPAGGVRRHHRDPRPGRRRARLARPAALRRGRRRGRLHATRRSPSSRRSRTSGCSGCPCRAAPRRGLDWKRIEGGLLRPGRGHRARTSARRGRIVVAAQADRRRAGRVRARVEGRAPRQVERDRARQRPPDDRHRRRPDEPRGRLPPRRDQARPADRQLRRRLRRLLPVPRRPRHPRRGGRDRGRRAGRLDPRPGDRRRGRRAAAWRS